MASDRGYLKIKFRISSCHGSKYISRWWVSGDQPELPGSFCNNFESRFSRISNSKFHSKIVTKESLGSELDNDVKKKFLKIQLGCLFELSMAQYVVFIRSKLSHLYKPSQSNGFVSLATKSPWHRRSTAEFWPQLRFELAQSSKSGIGCEKFFFVISQLF